MPNANSQFSHDELITAAMRVDGTIPTGWRYMDIGWTPAAVFDRIIEIGGEDLRILACSIRGTSKRGQIAFGPAAAQRVGAARQELQTLFESSLANKQ